VRAMGKGAQDYLLKGRITSDLLLKTIRYAVSRKRAELEKETISAISQLFLSSGTLDEIYSQVLKMLSDRFQFPIVVIELYDKDRNEMVFVNSVGIPSGGAEPMRAPVGETISGAVATSGEAASGLNASFCSDCRLRVLKELNTEIFLCVPMKIRGQILGTLTLADRIRHEDDGSLIDTLGIIANYLGQEIAQKRSNEELKKAKDAAEAADRAKTEFLSTMSHELLTPLNHILGFSGILRRNHNMTEEQSEFIEIIHRSGSHLTTIIRDMLDLCRIEAGRMTLSSTEIHLTGFLKGLTKMIQLRANEKGIVFATDFAADLPAVLYGDKKRLRQILVNILGNAVKFTEKGGVAFRVVPQTESRLRFEVEDTGIGIPADHTEKIFTPFHQARSHMHHTKGTGMGLAVSQRLARMMGTRLCLSSTVGQGSTFWFDIEYSARQGGWQSEWGA